MKAIKILAVKSEIGAGTRGASLGFDAVRIAALDFGSNFFRQFPVEVIADENDSLLDSPGSLHARRGHQLLKVCERLMHAVHQCVREHTFPILISGDHSTAAGTLAGLTLAYPSERIGVVWIDAHADIHSPFTTPSGNLHGMPLAAVLAEDNLSQRINTPDEAALQFWDAFKNLGGVSPKIRYDQLVYIGLRDFEPQEDFLIRQNRVRVFTTDEITNLGIDKIGREILLALEPCEHLYISFDVDSLDPSISRGTGTPAPNGLTEKQAAALLQRLLQSQRVCCFEVTEINPTLDRENSMAETVFEILLKVTNQLTKE